MEQNSSFSHYFIIFQTLLYAVSFQAVTLYNLKHIIDLGCTEYSGTYSQSLFLILKHESNIYSLKIF